MYTHAPFRFRFFQRSHFRQDGMQFVLSSGFVLQLDAACRLFVVFVRTMPQRNNQLFRCPAPQIVPTELVYLPETRRRYFVRQTDSLNGVIRQDDVRDVIDTEQTEGLVAVDGIDRAARQCACDFEALGERKRRTAVATGSETPAGYDHGAAAETQT